jgi:hypothetical protein
VMHGKRHVDPPVRPWHGIVTHPLSPLARGC